MLNFTNKNIRLEKTNVAETDDIEFYKFVKLNDR